MVFPRMVVVENGSPEDLEIRQYLDMAPSGRYRRAVRLKANSRIEIPASMFCRGNTLGLRPSVIRTFFNDESEASNPLLPQTFRLYVKIILCVDVDAISKKRLVKVEGVTPKWFDICRLWGFGFLGRNYAERELKPIP